MGSLDNTRAPLAYEIAVQAAAERRAALDSLRGRASTILAAGSLVAAFLGQSALRDPGSLTCLVIGILALVVVLALVGVILWPRPMAASIKPTEVLEAPRSLDSETAIKRELVLKLEEAGADDERRILTASYCLQAAAVAVVVEALALAFAIKV